MQNESDEQIDCKLCRSATDGAVNAATLILWCPTWINRDSTVPAALPEAKRPFIGVKVKGEVSDNPPMNLCEECAKIFQGEHNENARGKVFYWGDEAIAKYNEGNPKTPVYKDWDGRIVLDRGDSRVGLQHT
jgi:hypothetical protein